MARLVPVHIVISMAKILRDAPITDAAREKLTHKFNDMLLENNACYHQKKFYDIVMSGNLQNSDSLWRN